MNVATWSTAIAALGILISSLALLLTLRQTHLLARQMGLLTLQLQADHERSRREKAVDLLLRWSEGLQNENSSARKLVDALDDAQTQALWALTGPIVVDGRFINWVKATLTPSGTAFTVDAAGRITLDGPALQVIRWQVLRYLNTLESVLAAWRHNIADREILVEQFHFLISDKLGASGCQRFRQVAGGGAAYPAIGEFVAELRRRSEVGAGKTPLLSPAR